MYYSMFPPRCLPMQPSTSISPSFVRAKSISAAIESGRWASPKSSSRERYPERGQFNQTGDDGAPPPRSKPRWLQRGALRSRHHMLSSEPMSKQTLQLWAKAADPDPHSFLNYHGKLHRPVRSPKSSTSQPYAISFPFTTAASEFIYGFWSIVAAIKAKRRKLYKLYYSDTAFNRPGFKDLLKDPTVSSIAELVDDRTHGKAMLEVSQGRPHNGVILEASPIPMPPASSLQTVSKKDETFTVKLDKQSSEDLAVNGNQTLYTYQSAGWRNPLVVFVAGVLDQGNLGAIARSCCFLGVAALVTPATNTASWTGISIKASGGAAEMIPILKTHQPLAFLEQSSKAGWKIYASSAYKSWTFVRKSPDSDEEDLGKIVYSAARKKKRFSSDYAPLAHNPSILLLGGEYEGLDKKLVGFAHYNVSIPQAPGMSEINLDSMNVSDAASIMCYEMMRKPGKHFPKNLEETSDPEDAEDPKESDTFKESKVIENSKTLEESNKSEKKIF